MNCCVIFGYNMKEKEMLWIDHFKNDLLYNHIKKTVKQTLHVTTCTYNFCSFVAGFELFWKGNSEYLI